LVDAAPQQWTRKLIDPSRRNNLLYFRTLKTGTLDLSDAAPKDFADFYFSASEDYRVFVLARCIGFREEIF
jgi:hypothetical protein